MGRGGGGGGFPNTKGGRGNSTIMKDRQDKHIENTKNYNQEIANGKHPSILTEDPEELLKEGAGKGQARGTNKEAFDFGRVIGKFFDKKTGQYYNTTRGIIHYDSHGNAHIVPANPFSW